MQMAPCTSMNFPWGMLMVVPALMMSFDPSATVTSSWRFMVPDQVSVPVTVPCVVSFTAMAEGTLTMASRSDVM